MSEEWKLSELDERYGISRKTAYKWTERYEEDPVHGLAERSRAPKQHGRAMADDVRDAVLAMWRAHPRWGPKKLRTKLAERIPVQRGHRRAPSAICSGVKGSVQVVADGQSCR